MNPLLFSLILAAAGLTACSPSEPVGTAANAATPQERTTLGPGPNSGNLTKVRIQVLEPTSFSRTITLSGVTDADQDLTFSAETAGRLEQLTVALGQRVKKGQEIARIDYAMQKAQADQAAVSLTLAKRTHERLTTLRGEEMISEQAIDEALARLQSAEAQHEIARVNLERSRLVSPIDGIVARTFADQGEYVAPGMPVLQVVDHSTIVVKAQLPENQIAEVKRGDRATVRIDALGTDFEGKVHVILPAADPLSRTFQVRILVKNPEYRIRVGMAATVHLRVRDFKEVLVAPQDVVLEESAGRVVYLEEGGVARRRVVETALADGQRVLFTSGVAPGDRLIVLGQRGLSDGQQIQVVTD
ncbi:MAG: hypothetical protein A2284_08580 [Deltaproteobacteria bacterium RIFOXYA12_FULL_61_11]|nr:MAG: hypothetical protein A2284_08580 [Deltaproteobacteria bacterium RIFOXYA12_FULL_61_11]